MRAVLRQPNPFSAVITRAETSNECRVGLGDLGRVQTSEALFLGEIAADDARPQQEVCSDLDVAHAPRQIVEGRPTRVRKVFVEGQTVAGNAANGGIAHSPMIDVVTQAKRSDYYGRLRNQRQQMKDYFADIALPNGSSVGPGDGLSLHTQSKWCVKQITIMNRDAGTELL